MRLGIYTRVNLGSGYVEVRVRLIAGVDSRFRGGGYDIHEGYVEGSRHVNAAVFSSAFRTHDGRTWSLADKQDTQVPCTQQGCCVRWSPAAAPQWRLATRARASLRAAAEPGAS